VAPPRRHFAAFRVAQEAALGFNDHQLGTGRHQRFLFVPAVACQLRSLLATVRGLLVLSAALCSPSCAAASG